jgi:hypothetical protein
MRRQADFPPIAAAINSARYRIISASPCRIRSDARGSSMQSARRWLVPSRRSIAAKSIFRRPMSSARRRKPHAPGRPQPRESPAEPPYLRWNAGVEFDPQACKPPISETAGTARRRKAVSSLLGKWVCREKASSSMPPAANYGGAARSCEHDAKPTALAVRKPFRKRSNACAMVITDIDIDYRADNTR